MNIKKRLEDNTRYNLERSEILHEIKELEKLLAEKKIELERLTKKQYKLQVDINKNLRVKLGDLVNRLAEDYQSTPTVSAVIKLKKPVIVNYYKSKQQATNDYRIFNKNDFQDARVKIKIDMNTSIFANKTENTVFEFVRPFNPENIDLEKFSKNVLSKQFPNGNIEYSGIELTDNISQLIIDFTIDDISKTSNQLGEDYKTINPIQKGLKFITADIIEEYKALEK